jgi:hypothetical protein
MRLVMINHAGIKNFRQYIEGRIVYTVLQPGHRHRLIHTGSGNSSKKRLTYPCPQTFPPHSRQQLGRGQG